MHTHRRFIYYTLRNYNIKIHSFLICLIFSSKYTSFIFQNTYVTRVVYFGEYYGTHEVLRKVSAYYYKSYFMIQNCTFVNTIIYLNNLY